MKTTTILLLLFFALTSKVKSQGCSDAGFCSIGNLSHSQGSEKKDNTNHSIRLLLPLGLGDEEVLIFNPGIEYSYQKNSWQFQGKITGNYASGNLGSAAGAGDLFLSTTYIPTLKKLLQTSFTLGVKLPLNQGNLKENNLSLPMQYQSSLGTIDLIAGISVAWSKWKWAAGWQQPLSGINRNNFLPEYWDKQEAAAYPPSNDFNRKGDLLLRGTYKLFGSELHSLDAGLLAIYHLGTDSYINANISNRPIPITGSEGLTLNLTAAWKIVLNEKWSLGIQAGIPLVVRDIRPDGLTRSFVFAPQISYHF